MKTAPTRSLLIALLVATFLVVAGCRSTPVAEPARAAAVDSGQTDWERYRTVGQSLGGLVQGGTVNLVRWSDDGTSMQFSRDGDLYQVDLASGRIGEAEERITGPSREDDRGGRRGGRFPGRGRQRDREASPDGRWVAVCRDWNVVLETAEGEEVTAVTSGGTRKHRYGQASWVYGEELDQNSAMWWSPDSKKLAYYEFDEREVPDFHLLRGLSELRPATMVEGYPKPGEPNPIASLHVYDVETGQTVRIDTGSSAAADTGHYVYRVMFSPNGDHLLFSRTNRHQSVLELVAADLETGATRVVLREEQDTWQNNHPHLGFLEDGHRFIWESERTGFAHYELRDLDGGLLTVLTRGEHPCRRVVRVDEEAGVMWYMARSGENPLNDHLHRVNLDGSNDRRFTVDGVSHQHVAISPDGRFAVTTSQSVTEPPLTAVYDEDGEQVAVLAEADVSGVAELGLTPAELFSFTAADGETVLYGVLYKPSNFDPSRSYPLVVDVYGGPHSQGVRQRYSPARSLCELGFLVAKLDNRGTVGRGKAFESANYLKLGEVDLDDQAAGVRHLAQRSYVDGSRVGIYGSSYGGYMSALAVLKHPDVFHVAVAGSAVTAWENYDTIYTERYMRTPEENPDGYEQGSCMTFVDNLEGKLLIQHGMVDDNVHPTNAWQLAEALNAANKPYEMAFFANRGHGLGRPARTRHLEFLYEHLIAAYE